MNIPVLETYTAHGLSSRSAQKHTIPLYLRMVNSSSPRHGPVWNAQPSIAFSTIVALKRCTHLSARLSTILFKALCSNGLRCATGPVSFQPGAPALALRALFVYDNIIGVKMRINQAYKVIPIVTCPQIGGWPTFERIEVMK